MWKKFYGRLTETCGIVLLLCGLFTWGFPEMPGVKFYHMLTLLTIFATVVCFLAFDLRLFTRHIWVNRGIAWLLIMLFGTFLLWKMGFLGEAVTADEILKAFLQMSLTGGITVVVMWLISDAVERKKIRKINEKLKKNEEESEK